VVSAQSKIEATIHVDFHNADPDGYVRLNTVGSIQDLARHHVKLVDGDSLRITDGEIEMTGVVRRPGPEGQWRVEVDWREVFRLHAMKD